MCSAQHRSRVRHRALSYEVCSAQSLSYMSARIVDFRRLPLISRQISLPTPFQCPISSSSRRRLTKLDFRTSTNHTVSQYATVKPENPTPNHEKSSVVWPSSIRTPTVLLNLSAILASTTLAESRIAAIEANMVATIGQIILR